MRKQEIILFLYRVPKCPSEAEKIDFSKKIDLKKSNRVIYLPRDKILRRCERKMKVVNQKENKNKPIILRSVVFQLCYISGHLVLFSVVL